jgi:predicted nucleic acid-binding protein
MIFLDTNIISYYFNANNKVKEKLMEAVDGDEEICTTVINIYEILKGFRWRNNQQPRPEGRGMLFSRGG